MPTSFHAPRVKLSNQDQPLSPGGDDAANGEHVSSTAVCHETEDIIANFHRTITGRSQADNQKSSGRKTDDDDDAQSNPGSFAKFEEYLRHDQEKGQRPIPVSVCFRDVSTYGRQSGDAPVKTVWDAVWRTLTLQDIYEWSLKKIISPERVENGRPLIRNFTGLVRSGEMML